MAWSWRCVSLFPFLVMVILSKSHCQEIAIKHCNNFLPLIPDNIEIENLSTRTLQIPGPISSNGNLTEFRLEEQTIKCQNKTFDVKLDKGKRGNENFTPTGYLRIGFDFYNSDHYCISSETKNSIIASVCPVNCQEQLCITKCCPPDEVENIRERRCSFSGVKRWTPILHHEESSTKLSEEEHLQVRPHYIESKARCTPHLKPLPPYIGRHDFDGQVFNRKEIRLLKNGTLTIKVKSNWKPISGFFCLDGIQNFEDNNQFHSGDESDYIVLRFEHCNANFTVEDKTDIRMVINDVQAGLMLFSCSFLLLTIGVYVLLWEKQNIHGWTITSYVVCLTFMYIFLAAVKLFQSSESGFDNWFCVPNAIFAHFFFLTTFCWLTVINFDIWWTFRDMKPNPLRSKEIRRYLYYSTLAVGLPIFIIVVGQIIQSNECQDCDTISSLISPNYGKMSCFLHINAVGAYLYYPIGGLLGFNLIFFCSTIFTLYRHWLATKRVHEVPGNQSMESIKVFAKLFVVMGITWIFDLISWCFNKEKISSSNYEENGSAIFWAFFDCVNILQAVAIFFIFVFKRQILSQLWSKYPSMRPILSPLKKFPCCQQTSFDMERSKSTKTMDRNGSRKDSLANSNTRKESITNSRKDSFDKSFDTVEL